MKSIDERLADSNPVAQGYVPANYDQMVTRALRQSRSADPVWRTFRLRMAGSVAAASALTVLGVSVLSGAGSALPVLGRNTEPDRYLVKVGYGDRWRHDDPVHVHELHLYRWRQVLHLYWFGTGVQGECSHRLGWDTECRRQCAERDPRHEDLDWVPE